MVNTLPHGVKHLSLLMDAGLALELPAGRVVGSNDINRRVGVFIEVLKAF